MLSAQPAVQPVVHDRRDLPPDVPLLEDHVNGCLPLRYAVTRHLRQGESQVLGAWNGSRGALEDAQRTELVEGARDDGNRRPPVRTGSPIRRRSCRCKPGRRYYVKFTGFYMQAQHTGCAHAA